MSDAAARVVLLEAFAQRGIVPNARAQQGVQAIARFEGSYGNAWGANNWGAVQCSSRAPCSPGCVEVTDSDAEGVPYRGCFKTYPTHVDGAADLIRELYRRPGVAQALASGDSTRVAEAMRAARYFEAPASRYAKAIELNAKSLAASIPEPHVVARGGVLGAEPTGRKHHSIAGPFLFVLFLVGVRRFGTNARRSINT